MDKKEEFDIEFDFKKEFGFDPDDFLGDGTETAETSAVTIGDTAPEPVSDPELDELLSDDFLASLGIVREQESAPVSQKPEAIEEEPYAQPNFLSDDFAADEAPEVETVFSFDDLPAMEDIPVEPLDVSIPAPEPAFEVEPELGADFMEAFEKDFPEQEDTPIQEQADESPETEDTPAQELVAPAPRRRRKLSKERIIKEVYLPPIIAALTLILVIAFIGGAVGRGIQADKDKENAITASNEALSSALQTEADTLMAEAKVLADSYDYDGAIAKLDSFSGEMSKYQTMMDMYNTYTQARSKLVPYEDFASIPNLSFHGLIADPSRAFIDETYGKSYNQNYVTTDEFAKILQQLYDKNYVLVDFNSFIVETTSEDGTSYSTKPLYLPEGKKPLMLTQTLVNYEIFTIDSDGDGEADKGGDGFASRLIVDDNGDIVNEMVDASGNTVTGAYDLVPILNAFLEEHPDFSYQGAKALLAVTGEDGVFGYRIMHSVKESKGEDYYNQQVAGAKKIAQALRDDGYIIGCYTYGNYSYGEFSATRIQADLDMWNKEVTPVLGEIDILVYAKSSDISADGGYSGNNKYNVLKNEGFRYFVSSANVPWAEVTNEYVRQSRIMVTGGMMQSTPSTYSDYFDAASVLNELRGN